MSYDRFPGRVPYDLQEEPSKLASGIVHCSEAHDHKNGSSHVRVPCPCNCEKREVDNWHFCRRRAPFGDQSQASIPEHERKLWICNARCSYRSMTAGLDREEHVASR